MSSRFIRWTPAALLIIPFAFSLLIPAQAQTAFLSGSKYWETPIQDFVDTLVGPVSLGMILIGFVGSIWGFMASREINGFVRAMVVMIFSGSILFAVKPCLNSLFAT